MERTSPAAAGLPREDPRASLGGELAEVEKLKLFPDISFRDEGFFFFDANA